MARLCIFALFLIAIISPAWADLGSKTSYNIRDFGAVGDGKTLDNWAINQAIATCFAAGGGTVYCPAGNYLCGSIHLLSNIDLFIDAGATITGAPQEMKAYDPAEGPDEGKKYQDGGHSYFHNSLIWGENLTNVSITGRGMIAGGGLVKDSSVLDALCGFAPKTSSDLTQSLGTSATTDDEDSRKIGNKAIALKLCHNVLVRDITISHGGHFGILATGCSGMTIDNVTIDTNRDGIDIDSCQNTTVSNCRINSPYDDGLCLKSSFALGHNLATENLTITNCQVSGYQEGTLLDGTLQSGGMNGRIKFGTESNGGFRNCTITNCIFRCSRGLALEEVDGGIMENIVISNLSMMHITGAPIYITNGKRDRGPIMTSPSRIRNVLISNVVAQVDDHTSGIQVTGFPEQPLEGICLSNIQLIFPGGGTAADAARMPGQLGGGYPEPGTLGIMPSYAVFARDINGLQLTNIRASCDATDLRPALWCSGIDDLTLDNFKAQTAANVPPANFSGVKNASVQNSPGISAPAE